MKSIVILTSLYDDWESAAELFCSLGDELRRRDCPAQLVIINDASIEPCPPGFLDNHPGFSSVEVVTLNRNLGSQRALAVGLAHIFETKTAAAVVIMDADGEDRPADLMLLIEAFATQTTPKVIFAARAKRSESGLFQVSYQFYRALHYLFTGYKIQYGNFGLVPRELLGRLVVDPNLWLHFAATVISSRIPYTSIPTERGVRLHGKSKLNLIGLVIHAIAAISCYNEVVGVRLIFCSLGLGAVVTVLLITVVGIRLATAGGLLSAAWAVPGWATDAVGVLMILLVQVFIMVVAFSAIAIGNRRAQFFFPIQQYKMLIRDVASVQ
jgi:polyisoprenyl-phosphate glycosyltransferase